MRDDRDFFEPEHDDFRSAVRRFVDREVAGRLDAAKAKWWATEVLAARGIRQLRAAVL
jgi:hypothetical protein